MAFGAFTETAFSKEGGISSSLPPPPMAVSVEQSQDYQLELVINQFVTGEVVPIIFRQGQYFVSASALQQAGIRQERLTTEEVNLSAMPEVDVHYESESQRLRLDVPPAWLQSQSFSGDEMRPRYPAQSHSGALFNYDIYVSRVDGGGTPFSIGNELRLFGQYGYLSNTGLMRSDLSGNT